MLSALDVYNGLSPPYAAMVIAELHRNANGTYYVKVFYKNGTDSDSLQPLTLPGKMLTHLCLAPRKRDIGKQCRPRSDATVASDPGLHCLH